MFDGMEQGGIDARQPGQHLRIALIALAFVARDGVDLPRVGHDDCGPVFSQEPTYPGAVRAGLHRDRGVRKLREEFQQS